MVLTGWLFLETSEDVFYSGDLGLKYLMLQQYARGNFSLYLDNEKPDWVNEVWDDGLYPIKPPFVIQHEGGRVVLFPIWFQLVSTPFYLLFGFRGLYILPTLALWLVWWRFIILARFSKFPGWVTLLLVIGFIFGTPLLVYGAIFWEHTLAVFLVLVGLEFTFRIHDAGMTISKSILIGALFGSSVWIRPESFLIALPVAFFLALRFIRKHNPKVTGFIISMPFIIYGFMLTNWLIYEFPLGVHGTIAVFNSLYWKFFYAYGIFIDLLRRTWMVFPLSALIVIVLPVFLLWARRPVVLLLTALLILFMAAVPFVLVNSGGKQWGARYLFVLYPVVLMLAGFQLVDLRILQFGLFKFLYLAILFSMLGFGIYMNSVQGSAHIVYNYRDRLKPELEYLQDVQPEAIAAGDAYVAQSLAPLYHEMSFFLAEDNETFRLLVSHLHKQRICQFVFVMDPYNDSLPTALMESAAGNNAFILTITGPSSYGFYDFYLVKLNDCDPSHKTVTAPMKSNHSHVYLPAMIDF